MAGGSQAPLHRGRVDGEVDHVNGCLSGTAAGGGNPGVVRGPDEMVTTHTRDGEQRRARKVEDLDAVAGDDGDAIPLGRPPRNKGVRYPADPPTVEEIVSVMRAAGDSLHGQRLRGLIVVLWRAGLRISEALALAESDLDARRGAVLVRRGKGGRRREVGMDDWAWLAGTPAVASAAGSSCRSDRCSASSPARPADDGGPAPRLAARSATPRLSPESAGASRRISCVTRTRSRWPTRASR